MPQRVLWVVVLGLRRIGEQVKDASRFDRLTKAISRGSRRGVVRTGIAALSLAIAALRDPNADEVAGKTKRHRHHGQQSGHDHHWVWNSRKKKKKKKKCAKAGQSTSKKRKQCCSGLVQDGTGLCQQTSPPSPPPPPPSPCVPQTCPAHPCGSFPDGCGGTLQCGCPANQVCLAGTCQPCIDVGGVCQPCIMVEGVCQPCTVSCPSADPLACGDALQAAMNGGGTVYVCPGQYQASYLLMNDVHVIGAGQGADPTSDTILDAAGVNRVLEIDDTAALVKLERLRITGGEIASIGAGITHGGTTLLMTDCTVSGNTTVNASGGAGIYVDPTSTLEMTGCTVRDNHATGNDTNVGLGGGILTNGPTTLTDCVIEGNTAGNEGGGLYISAGTTILAGSTEVRGNTANRGGGILNVGTLQIAETCRVTHNTAAAVSDGGGIFNDASGTVTLDGASPSPIVVDNCRDNCAGTVPNCAATPVSCPP